MKSVAKAVIETGIIDEDTLREMHRWGVPIQDPGTGDMPAVDETIAGDRQRIVEHIREALESEEQVRVDETDLDLLRTYLDENHQKTGRLILKEEGKHSSKKISFCITPMGEYAIPWTDPTTEPSIIYNGSSHLRWEDKEGTKHDVYFTEARDVFFGEHRAFIVCEVRKKDV